jgi:hypothetical protein
MGYDTRYTLVVHNDDYTVESHTKEIDKLAGYTQVSAFWEEGVGSWDKKHERDMKKYSKKHPTVLFELIGKGENDDDRWKKYFKNGKMQVCKAKITYPKFNESKLE